MALINFVLFNFVTLLIKIMNNIYIFNLNLEKFRYNSINILRGRCPGEVSKYERTCVISLYYIKRLPRSPKG